MSDWITYANQGATRNLPISPDLISALSFFPELGIRGEVYSGGQYDAATAAELGAGRVGSTRHDNGGAGDLRLYQGDTILSHANPAHIPILQEIVARARANGVTGIGMGPGYMGDNGIHLGFGAPAVWGAGGSSANAPDWLREAYFGAPAAPAPTAGHDPSRPPSVFNQPPAEEGPDVLGILGQLGSVAAESPYFGGMMNAGAAPIQMAPMPQRQALQAPRRDDFAAYSQLFNSIGASA